MEIIDLQSSPIRKNINSLDPGQLSIFEDKDGKFEGEAGSERYVGIRAKEILSDVLNMEDGTLKGKAKKQKCLVRPFTLQISEPEEES